MTTGRRQIASPPDTTPWFSLPWLYWEVSSTDYADLELAKKTLDEFATWAGKTHDEDRFERNELASYLKERKRGPAWSLALQNLGELLLELTKGDRDRDNPGRMHGATELLTDVAKRAGVNPELIRRWVEAGAIELHSSEQGGWVSTTGEFEKVLGHLVRSGERPKQDAAPPRESTETGATLPDWCNVFQGLSDEEIAEFEAIALDRSSFMRPSS